VSYAGIGPKLSVVPNLPSGLAVGVAQVAKLPVGFRLEAVAFDAAKCFGDAFGHVFATIEGNEQTAPWHQIHEALECDLDRFEIGIDVRVIELNVCEDQRVRKVVLKLRAFIEEGRIVFVAFDDECARGAKLEAGAEIFCNTADQE